MVSPPATKAVDNNQENKEEQVETTEVKIMRYHPDYAYFVGDTAELPKDEAAKLVASQHAMLPQTDEQR
jgi:hypothetical protein